METIREQIENQLNNNYKLYGSKTPIWWNKLTEDKPSMSAFRDIVFDWEMIPSGFNFVNQFKSTIFLPEKTWTYFKLENTETNEITYWLIDDKEMVTSNGVLYGLGLDIWTTYNMELFENFDNNMLIGVERTHLTIGDYYKYNGDGIVDDMLNFGSNGDKGYVATNLWPVENGVISITTKPNNVVFKYRLTTDDYYATKYLTRCFVFATTNPHEKSFIVFPIIDTNNPLIKAVSGVNQQSRYLGNSQKVLEEYSKDNNANFLGVYNLPLLATPVSFSLINYNKTLGNITYNYELMGLEIDIFGEQYNRIPLLINKDILGIQNNIVYNQDLNTDIKVNMYGWLNTNKVFYNRDITPLYTFNNVGDSIGINVGNRVLFNHGFMSVINNRDIISYGGQLPSNQQKFANYMNSIREQMNTSIKVSRDSAIMGSFKGVSDLGIGIAGALTQGNPTKGIGQGVSGVFNLAGSILNHENNKLQYAAQIADAKNSIQTSFNNSAEDDLRMNTILNKEYSLVDNGIYSTVMLKSFSKLGAFKNNNTAFLYGVKIANKVQLTDIRKVLDRNDCIYLELMQGYVKSELMNYVEKKFPFMDLLTKQVIVDAWNVGYRIWKLNNPDLTKNYTMIIGDR